MSFSKKTIPKLLVPLFQDESSCKTFYLKMSLICRKMNTQVEHISPRMVLHKDSFWHGQKPTGKWLIEMMGI